MKFVSFLNREKQERAGLLVGEQVFDLKTTMEELLKLEEKGIDLARKLEEEAKKGKVAPAFKNGEFPFLAPVPHPTSCRDGYAFRQHVAAARRNRGVPMIAEFDQFPIFYFTNHLAIVGDGDVTVEQDHLQKLDFELEAAIVIGKRGKNIPSSEADRYIAGYTIMNDLSARTLQMEEMLLSLGPAKGKDFATAIGPYLVTPDELESKKIKTSFGNKYDLTMKAFHNGKQVSQGNMKDMDWTFAEIIERASYGVELLPGDLIGSGTCGTGCYMELNGTWALEAKEKGGSFTPVWIQDGDTIELEIANLGRLKNRIVKAKKNYSILEKKKKPTI